MMHRHAMISLLLVLFLAVVGAVEEVAWSFKHVQHLRTIADLRASGLESNPKLWLALYSAPDDPLLAALDQTAQDLPYAVTAAWFSEEVAHSFGLQAAKLPILLLFRDEPKWNPYQERQYRTVEVANQFPSSLDARGIKKIVRDKVPSKVLTALPDEPWTAGQPPRVVLVSKKASPSLLFKALSVEFPSLTFYALADAPDTRDRFLVQDVPTLFVGTTAVEPFTDANGDLTNVEDLRRFLQPHVPQDTDGKKDATPSLWLTRDEFDQAPKTGDAWLVVVQSQANPTLVDPLSDEWKQVVQDLRSKVGLLVHVAMVDDPSPPAAGLFTIRYGASTALEKATTVASAATKLIASIPDKTSALYSPHDIQSFFGRMLQAPSPTLSFILFTNKKETPVVVQALALAFPGTVQVGVVFNPDDETKKQFGIGKVPTMVAVMMPLDPSVPRDQFSMTFYDKKIMGPPVYENTHRFLAHVVQAYIPKAATDDDNDKAASHATAATVHAATRDTFDKVCTSLCVIGLTKGADDTATLQILDDAAQASARAKHPLQYVHVDAVCQPGFASALGAEEWHVPTVAVYSPGKRRYVKHVGGMDTESVTAFVQSVIAGKTKTAPMSAAPELTVECAAGVGDEDVVAEDDDDAGEMEEMLREIREEEKRQAEARKRELKQEAEDRKTQAKLKAAEEAKKAQEASSSTKKKKPKKKKKPAPKDEL
ncbi:Aste57867_15100 [Aphanomyces stellatus]|uniref:Aste57867_15100 protein n=1 Tax=Aphanomyces stellatus TaxID=120398 RepID=A0A485L2E2_9STRA|nr:hypothetical protein As57867_015044 [Aphanomyces stellatus]VFT91913.1 Aste57867_15100 [Aphanomyces stellatus]